MNIIVHKITVRPSRVAACAVHAEIMHMEGLGDLYYIRLRVGAEEASISLPGIYGIKDKAIAAASAFKLDH